MSCFVFQNNSSCASIKYNTFCECSSSSYNNCFLNNYNVIDRLYVLYVYM